MPENNQILSVEGQLIGMPTAGPESFSQQQLDYLKRALGVDETVLWEDMNNTTQLYSGTTYFNLSEAYLNFERIRVYYKNSFSQLQTMTETYVLQSGDTRLGVSGYAQADNNWTQFDRAIISFVTTDSTRMKVIATTRAGISISGSSISSTTGNGGIIPLKVIGIHRIAGGN